MKRRLLAVAAAVMILALGAGSVFAASSPTEEDGYSEAAQEAVGNISADDITAVDAMGKNVSIEVTPVSGDQITDEDTALAAAEEAVGAGLVDLNVGVDEEVVASVLGVVEVKLKDNGEFPVTLTIPVYGVSAGDSVILLHFVDGAWETILPSVVGDGYVVAEFDSFSPIAVVLIESSEIDLEDYDVEAEETEEPDDSEDALEDDTEADDEDDDSNDSNNNKDNNDTKTNSTKKTDDNSSGASGNGNQNVSVKANGNTFHSASPVTGDQPYVYIYAAVLFAAVIALGATVVVKCKHKRTK